MSKSLIYNKDGTWKVELESMDMCKWLVDDVCCNDKCDCLAGYPYPRSICELDEDGENSACGCFEVEAESIRALRKYNAGLISAVEYRMIIFGESKEIAEKAIEEIKATEPTAEQLVGNEEE